MRLFRDRPDVLTEGQWYFCPDGAVSVPFPHSFGSRVWDPDSYKDVDPPLGEVGPQGPLVDGIPNPRLTGAHFCGAPEVWRNGVPFGTPPLPVWPDGIPICCQTGPPGEDFCILTEAGADLELENGTGCIEVEH